MTTSKAYNIRKHPRITGDREDSYIDFMHVYPFEGTGSSMSILVKREKEYEAKAWKPTTVSWVSLGDVSLDQAEAYGKAILAAVVVGRGMQE